MSIINDATKEMRQGIAWLVFAVCLTVIMAFVILKTPHPVEVQVGPGYETCTTKGC